MTEQERAHWGALYQHVGRPTFFAKMAAELGASPATEEEANAWLLTAEKIAHATGTIYQQVYSPSATLNEVAKSAGAIAPPQPVQPLLPDVADFFRDPLVKAAAEALTMPAAPVQAAPAAPPVAAAIPSILPGGTK